MKHDQLIELLQAKMDFYHNEAVKNQEIYNAYAEIRYRAKEEALQDLINRIEERRVDGGDCDLSCDHCRNDHFISD